MKNPQSNFAQQRQQTERKYQSMIEKISDAIISLDTDWCINYISKKAEQILDRPPGYLIGKNIWIEFPACAEQPIREAFDDAMSNQEYVYAEEYWPAGDLWLENHIYPSPDGLSIYFKDITQRKKKELDFNKLAHRNALLIQMTQNSFLLTDADLNVVDVNPAFCKTSGYSKEELLTMNVRDFDTELLSNEITSRLTKAREIGVIEFETKNRRKNGEILDVEVVLTEMEIDGKLFFASFGRDISERKRAEEQIINEKKLSDSIINSMPGIFYLYNEKGKFLRWNKNFETISGYNAEEISGMKPIDFFDDDEKQTVKSAVEKVFTTGGAEVEGHFLTKAGGKIPYYFNGRLTIIDGQPCLLGMGLDISKHKQSEEAIRVMEKEILKQKVQELKKISRAIIKTQETERNYLGGELHDNVNQILATTRMYLNVASKKDEKTRELIEFPLQLVDSAINEIRLLTAKNVAPLRNIDLKHLINLLIDNISKTTSLKLDFIYTITSEVINDELKLNVYRIIQEQLNNIIKHSGASQITISIKIKENCLCLRIADNGKGFDANKKREGTGLFNITNRVQSFNGDIVIESSQGNGCSLAIEIPYDL
jgi:PAS domain S-box-containing protein